MKLPFFGHTSPAATPDPIATPGTPADIPPHATIVLMVDDEPAQRQLFSAAVRREGYFVLEARNGAEALDVAEQAGRVDLLITDVVMPIMRGPELARRLTDRFPDVRVLFVTGFAPDGEISPNARLMHKPFVRKDLVQSVIELIGPPRQAA